MRRRPLLGLGLAAPWCAGLQAAGDELRVVGPWEIAGLEPATSGYLFTRMQVTQTLVDCDAQGRLRPGLAQRWQVAADGLDWQFSLQPEVRCC